MREKTKVIIIAIVIFVLGFFAVYLSLFLVSFTFERTELNIENSLVQEKLFYTANKDYHTLYRDFQTSILDEPSSDDYIKITNVNCAIGAAYKNNYDKCYMGNCLIFTESNEYGCTFGNDLGFKKGEEYQIGADFELHPKNLIKIKDKYYIKFIAYSTNRHPFLVRDVNFFVAEGVITKKIFLPLELIRIRTS